MTIKRPAFHYHGGKWKLAPWILRHFPPHTIYVEPFGGAASLMLRKRPAPNMTVYNDLSNEVVNFFDVLRGQPDALINAINLTPYSRYEYQRTLTEPAPPDPLERARRFYVRSEMAVGGVSGRTSGFRLSLTPNRSTEKTWCNIQHLHQIAQRFKGILIEHDDAIAVIERYDTADTLFYVDPPYVQKTRSTAEVYAVECDDSYHRALASVLHEASGKVVLSGYESPLYDGLYPDWEQFRRDSKTTGHTSRVEVLWLNAAASRSRLPLFAGLDSDG